MDRKKGILLVSLAAAFLAALICVAAVFFPQHTESAGDYFVEYSLSDDFYVDGEPLSRAEREELSGEIGSLLKSLEEQFAVERSGSDIARINAAPAGEEVAVSAHTYTLLGICKELYSSPLFGGSFTPALYDLSELWGFSPDHEGHYNDPRPEPAAGEIAAALSHSGFSCVELRGENIVVKTDGEVRLDLGGIAKGYMSDAAADLVREKYAGSRIDGILTVMSDSVLFGQKRDAATEGGLRGYTMQIDNPRALTTGTGRAAVAVGLSDIAVSTSADTYRFYVWEDEIYKHILDPHTGRPSDNGAISISVFVPLNGEWLLRSYAGALADALSTAGFCMPLRQALDFYEKLAEEYGIGAVVITEEFRYYVIGEYEILDPSAYEAGDEDVFLRSEAESAPEKTEKCEEEQEYIAYVAGLNA